MQSALTSISSSLRSEASIFGSSPAVLLASSGGRDTLLDRLDRGGFLILNFLGFLPLNMGLYRLYYGSIAMIWHLLVR